MAKDEKESLWYRLWDHRSLKEKKRLRSFIPYILYGGLVFYGIIYLSILNTVNRERTGTTVKTGFGGIARKSLKPGKGKKGKLKKVLEPYANGFPAGTSPLGVASVTLDRGILPQPS